MKQNQLLKYVLCELWRLRRENPTISENITHGVGVAMKLQVFVTSYLASSFSRPSNFLDIIEFVSRCPGVY